jgi:hypothetical protein
VECWACQAEEEEPGVGTQWVGGEGVDLRFFDWMSALIFV